MSSSELATLRVSSDLDGLEISVADAHFRQVAHGFGDLEAKLAPGLYEIEYCAGPALQTKLVKLLPGSVHLERPERIEIASAAPLDGTSTSRESHQRPAIEASQGLYGTDPALGALIVMVRNLRGQDELPFDERTVEGLSVVGRGLTDATGAGGGWRVDAAADFALWTAPLKPGGYALRSSRDGTRCDQAVWLSRGWQTLVFVPNTVDGPAPELASVHMAQMDMAWEPRDARLGLALELAFSALREGRGLVPRDLLNLLLHGKFVNPMLGIIGAHVLLLESRPNLDLCGKVLSNLGRLVPDHPDVYALEWLMREAYARRAPRDPMTSPPDRSLSWPPMLLSSYNALLRLDANDPGVIEDGSVAERAAAQLVVNGVWSAWRPLEPAAAGTRGVVGTDRATADPAVDRVAEYVRRVAALNESDEASVLERLSHRQVALATGLPTASVRRALEELGEQMGAPA